MLLKNEVEVGKTYVWDIDGGLGSLHEGTLTVTIKEIKDNDIAIVESEETSELFDTHINWLTTLERAEKILEAWGKIEPSEGEVFLEIYFKKRDRLRKALKK